MLVQSQLRWKKWDISIITGLGILVMSIPMTGTRTGRHQRGSNIQPTSVLPLHLLLAISLQTVIKCVFLSFSLWEYDSPVCISTLVMLDMSLVISNFNLWSCNILGPLSFIVMTESSLFAAQCPLILPLPHTHEIKEPATRHSTGESVKPMYLVKMF